MAVFDVANRTLTLKLVYYGCAISGKTTNLSTLHRLTDPDGAQGLVSIATNDDRTLFFDLLPMDLGQIGGMNVKIKLYTVPGQVHYELTRRQVLQGADGVVLVIDSSPAASDSNAWAFKNLTFNLDRNGLDPRATPIVLQWNKRDIADALPVHQLQAQLNPRGLPAFEAVAITGQGVIDTFAALIKLAIAQTYVRTGRPPLSEELISRKVEVALETARCTSIDSDVNQTFDHRFDMDAYKDEQAERGRDRRVVDQDSLLSEAVNTNMMLAERLESLRSVEAVSDRRARLMIAVSQLAPMLANGQGDALPAGVLKLALDGCDRSHGSLMLRNGDRETLDEREVIPSGRDPLNRIVHEGLGSVARRLCIAAQFRVIDSIENEVFYGAVTEEVRDLASMLIAPLGCDGMEFGVMFVYSKINDPMFDETECGYWKTVSTLIGLSLHWHALRQKLGRAIAS